jgi:ParB family transcriptional regulator, chromosome partitioning protein
VNNQPIELLPIANISVPNPRTRNKVVFDLIVANISEVGLKKPITVCRRAAADGEDPKYDLVCGQGRLEACLALGETRIPAVVVEATKEQQYLMSLVENIARRPPSNRDLLREIKAMTGRGLKPPDIAAKLGLDRGYIYGIVKLLEQGEESLITSVESRRLPISVATVIARGTSEDVRRALKEAYDNGELRGQRLAHARRIIAYRLKKRAAAKGTRAQKKMSSRALISEYRREIEKTKALVKRASITNQRLLLLVSMMRRLFADENFVVLLKAESLMTMPAWLAAKVGEGEHQ